MKQLFFKILIMFVSAVPAVVFAGSAASSHEVIRHDLKVALYPEERRFAAEDTITLPEGFRAEFRFYLHKGLDPVSPAPEVSIVRDSTIPEGRIYESFKVSLAGKSRTFIIKYGGVIHHPVEPYGKEQARGFRDTPGIISEEGVYLSGGSFWYPVFESGLLKFTLNVELPAGWDAVSQGDRSLHNRNKNSTLVKWESPEPQDEIFLIASKFTEYSQKAGRITAMAFLRSPDKALAEKYLDATARYVTMYEKLIGAYPYGKFALVENFWETGFGMPSFTLLGPKVIRLPFIINSSYPHEILHNWWGNSVFPDYMSGNWAEGLTAYLSDHLIKEQQGSGAEYRQATLQKYADYVAAERDFPLAEFRSRHSSSSEAVGYGKSLMFFHMLRVELGDKIFTAGLQDFYAENKFRTASFNDLRKSFEKVSGKDLKKEFSRWITQPGAPELKLREASARATKNGYVVSAVIEQVQPGASYRLNIPAAVTMEGQKNAYQTSVVMDGKRLSFEIRVPARPLRIDIDPEFDIFRRLGRDEIPPAISLALGAKKMLVLLPSSAHKDLLQAYRNLAGAIANSGPDEVEIKLDRDIRKLPPDRAVTVLGWENLFFRKTAPVFSKYDAVLDSKNIRFGRTKMRVENHSLVITARNPENKNLALMFIASGNAEAMPGLGRKLPHYHKYSYLGFEGDEPVNIAKGRWDVTDSPMTAFFPGRDGKVIKAGIAGLAPREPLAVLSQVFSQEKMMETIVFLAGKEAGGRGAGTEGLDKAAEYIAQKFREAGLKPAGSSGGSYFQTWQEELKEVPNTPAGKTTMKNVIGVIPGTKPGLSGQSIVIGAHYDHLGTGQHDARQGNKGEIHPGADDNASGVAVLTELARTLVKSPAPDRSIVFAAFAGEEAGRLGSKYYITGCMLYPANKSIAMLNLDTVGRLGKKKLLVLGTGSASEWIHIFRGAGYVTGVEIEAVPERLDSSDNISFEEAGVPAVQLFTGPHPDYHRPSDTADKIDAVGLVRVASVAKEVVEYLAKREEPLTASGKTGEKNDAPKRERKAAIGTIPDFAFSGKGCRLSGVMPGSPAEECGLKEGDIIIRINNQPVSGLRDLSDILKTISPGTRLSITFVRDGREMTLETETAAK